MRAAPVKKTWTNEGLNVSFYPKKHLWECEEHGSQKEDFKVKWYFAPIKACKHVLHIGNSVGAWTD